MHSHHPPGPTRKLWFFLGLVAGVMLLPYVAGLSHREVGQRVLRRVLRGKDVAWRRLSPHLERGMARLRQEWDEMVDENLPANFPAQDEKPDGGAEPDPPDGPGEDPSDSPSFEQDAD